MTLTRTRRTKNKCAFMPADEDTCSQVEDQTAIHLLVEVKISENDANCRKQRNLAYNGEGRISRAESFQPKSFRWIHGTGPHSRNETSKSRSKGERERCPKERPRIMRVQSE